MRIWWCVWAVGLSLLLAVLPARAGNVKATQKGGTLTLKGDGHGAVLGLSGALPMDVGVAGQVVITPMSGTTVNATTGLEQFNGVANVNLAFGAHGDNAVSVQLLTLDGSITYKGGSGSDLFSVSGSQLMGNLTVAAKGALGFSCTTSSQVGGKLSVKAAAADDSANLNCPVGGGVSVSLGDGDNAVSAGGTLGDIVIFDSLQLKTGRGSDDVTLSFLNLLTSGKLDLGSGSNVLQLKSVALPGDLQAKGKAGSDIVITNSLTVGGDVNFALGDGNNHTQLESTEIDGALFISGGRGDDVVLFVNPPTIGHGPFYRLDGGNNEVP
ncbi:MAG TPA: hypothetical protein VMR50_00060 [Myxococcota bacterium]|nr:hypothetical protein [Myxococcota bacterium]